MATVAVTLTRVSNNARSGLNAVMPSPDAASYASASVTSSGTSQQAAVTSPDDAKGMFWIITASGNDVWVTFGTNPTAAAGTSYLVVSGTTRDFAASANQKCAIIDKA